MLMPAVLPIAAQITPMVAEVAKAEPVSTETAQFRRKVISKKTEGRMNPAA
jgi:hypothetical protein